MGKTRIYFYVALVILPSVLISQVMSKKDQSINAYFGYSVFRSYYISVAEKIAEDENIEYSINTSGPIGLMYEYMLADVIGLGGEFGYSATELNWIDEGLDINFNPIFYNYKANFQTTRLQLRMNFHFVKDEHLDAYFLFNAGYRRAKLSIDTNDPFYVPPITLPSLFPFGVKMGVGVRYFFLKNFGFNAEFALGSPMVSGGITVRF